MVSQALRADDRILLEQCLAIQDPAVVRATMRRLPTQHVLPFLKAVRDLRVGAGAALRRGGPR